MPGCKEAKLRRFALQVVQQLPENKADALLVMEFVREIILWENGILVEAAGKIVRLGA